jgi:hypothetical protein
MKVKLSFFFNLSFFLLFFLSFFPFLSFFLSFVVPLSTAAVNFSCVPLLRAARATVMYRNVSILEFSPETFWVSAVFPRVYFREIEFRILFIYTFFFANSTVGQAPSRWFEDPDDPTKDELDKLAPLQRARESLLVELRAAKEQLSGPSSGGASPKRAAAAAAPTVASGARIPAPTKYPPFPTDASHPPFTREVQDVPR